MARRLSTVLAVGLFLAGTSGMALANEQHAGWYGSGDQAVSSPNEGTHSEMNSSSEEGAYSEGTTRMEGPVETGSMPDQGLSWSERHTFGGEGTRNIDPSKEYPGVLWSADPWPGPNIQAGE